MSADGNPQQEQMQNIFLVSVESFQGGLPSHKSIGCTIGFIFCVLCIVEHTLRYILFSAQHLHPLLEDETKRNILARHLGVDALSCFVVASFGWKARHLLQEVWEGLLQRRRTTIETTARNDTKEVAPPLLTKAYDNRLFKYYPEAARIMVFFVGFQFKNLIDSIVWREPPEYIAHHILAIGSAGGGLLPGACHFYGIFYFGLSECSTGILCVLVNFDDDHGVPGLADAFPLGKMVLGGLFALSFVAIRVVCWGTVTSYYFRDVRQAFRDDHPKLVAGRRVFFYLNNCSLGFITVLQIVWLFDIIKIAKSELGSMGVFG